MHDLGEIGRGQRTAIVDGMKTAEHLVRRPWQWKSRGTRAVPAGHAPPSCARARPSTTSTHPPGLYVICIAELCERFAGCLLLSLLVLYLTERLGQPPAQAIRWVGTLNAAGYVAALGGGWLVGRELTAHRGATLGALLLTAGFVCLAMEHGQSLLVAFVLLTSGSGLFRPAIALLLSQLYASEDSQRDAGHTWFWAAVNVGSALAPLAAGSLRAVAGWQSAFAAAALSMLSCLIVLSVGRHHLRIHRATVRPDVQRRGSLGLRREGHLPLLGAASIAALLYAAASSQIDGALLLWARDQTNRVVLSHEIPTAWFSSLPALLVLLLGPSLLKIMNKLRENGYEPSPLRKMTLGLMIIGAGYAVMATCAATVADDDRSPLWLLLCCTALVLGELLIVPIGLALVTRLFAHRYGGLGSGLWFAVTAVGSWLGAELAAMSRGGSGVWLFLGLSSLSLIGAAMVTGLRRFGNSGAWEFHRP